MEILIITNHPFLVSKIIYMLLYPNQWIYSIKVRDFGKWWYIERLPKKLNNGDFSNFGLNKINSL